MKDLTSYADQLELIGILKKWNDKKKNTELTRVIELTKNLIFHINRQELEIEDLKVMNSAIREEKNKQILKYRDGR
jgi:hypothetical protein